MARIHPGDLCRYLAESIRSRRVRPASTIGSISPDERADIMVELVRSPKKSTQETDAVGRQIRAIANLRPISLRDGVTSR